MTATELNNISFEDLKKALILQDGVNKLIKNRTAQFFAEMSRYPINELLRKFYLLNNGQTLGNFIKDYLKWYLNLKSSEEIADCTSNNNKEIEVKHTSLDTQIAFKQVRLNRNIDFFIFSHLASDNIWNLYLLSKNDLLKEINNKKINKGNTHGKDATHLTITFSKIYLNYLSKYKCTLDEIKYKLSQ